MSPLLNFTHAKQIKKQKDKRELLLENYLFVLLDNPLAFPGSPQALEPVFQVPARIPSSRTGWGISTEEIDWYQFDFYTCCKLSQALRIVHLHY